MITTPLVCNRLGVLSTPSFLQCHATPGTLYDVGLESNNYKQWLLGISLPYWHSVFQKMDLTISSYTFLTFWKPGPYSGRAAF